MEWVILVCLFNYLFFLIKNSIDEKKINVDPNDPAQTAPNLKDTLNSVLSSNLIEPPIAPALIEGLSEIELKQLFNYLFFSTRLKDKMVFIDLLGNEEFINLYKEVMPFIIKPINQIYSHGDMATLLKEFFQMLKNCMKIAEDSKVEDDQKKNQYGTQIKVFMEVFYQSIRKIVSQDKGILHDIVHWFLDLVESNHIVVDMNTLVRNFLEKNEQVTVEQIKQEILAFSQFAQLETQLKREGKLTVYNCPMPQLPILKLVKPSLKTFIKQNLDEINKYFNKSFSNLFIQ